MASKCGLGFIGTNWSDSTPFLFRHWETSQPDNDYSQCVAASFSDTGKWLDEEKTATQSFPFICYKPSNSYHIFVFNIRSKCVNNCSHTKTVNSCFKFSVKLLEFWFYFIFSLFDLSTGCLIEMQDSIYKTQTKTLHQILK